MGWLYRDAIRNPIGVIVLAFTIVLVIAPGALRLRLRTDGHALVPKDAPEIEYDRQIRRRFNVQDQIIVVVDTGKPDGVFNSETLRLVIELSEAFRGIDGIAPQDVVSLATEKTDRVFPGTLKFRTFLDPFPETERQLARLKKDLRQIKLFTGALISFDGSAASILVATATDSDRSALHEAIQREIDAVGDIPERIYVAGAPIAESMLGTHILEDLLGTHALRLLAKLGITRPVGEAFAADAKTRFSLIAAALAIMAVVFAVAFRSVPAVALPLMEVGACLVFTFSLMGWCGVPVYLTVAVLPVILTAIGVADELHIFSHYRHMLRRDHESEHPHQLIATMNEMWRPVVKTSVTSAIGFLAFALSPIEPVRAFGIFMAVGIAFCMMWSMTVVPAMLSLIGPKAFSRRSRAATGGVGWWERLGGLVLRRKWVCLLGVGLLVAASPTGVKRLLVQDSWIDGFSPDSAFHKATTTINEKFNGSHLLLVDFDTGPVSTEGPFERSDIRESGLAIERALLDDPRLLANHQIRILAERPEPTTPEESQSAKPRRRRKRVLFQGPIKRVENAGDKVILHTPGAGAALAERIDRMAPGVPLSFSIEPEEGRLKSAKMVNRVGALESFIASHEAERVGAALGYHAHLATTHFMLKRRDEAERRIPERDKTLWRCLDRYRRLRGSQRVRELVDQRQKQCLITVFLKEANFVDTARLMDEIRAYEREHLTPLGVKLGFSGDVAVSQAMIGGIVTTQTRSLLLSLVGIVLVTAILFRSPLWGILCVLPAAMAVLMNFAVMGWLNVPLGVATSMFSGMTIGVGVDYAIHLMERVKLNAARGGGTGEAIKRSLVEAGPAIAIDASAVALGFGVLLFSQVPANRRLGGLVMLAVGTCLVATFVLLPALLAVLGVGGKESGAESSGDYVVGE
ncbi:MAG: MMPL family transporter [Planctomycetes bacterium]|nr:MMPL family transporter [Planctomycetota bacterium]